MDLASLLAALPDGVLPPGRLVSPQGGGEPRYWLSDGPPRPGQWAALRALHPASGLWPLMLDPDSADDPIRPWQTGEVYPPDPAMPRATEDVDALLGSWWAQYAAPDGDPQDPGDSASMAELLALISPFDDVWPGLAAAGDLAGRSPAAVAATIADLGVSEPEPEPTGGFLRRLTRRTPRPSPTRLGLVAAAHSADAPDAIGWDGRANYAEGTGETAVVLRSWEERFGVEVVGLTSDMLTLSVAAPPTTHEHALRVAAELFAFCPDLVWQGVETLQALALGVVESDIWAFWWD